jgi:hypothetical protein
MEKRARIFRVAVELEVRWGGESPMTPKGNDLK